MVALSFRISVAVILVVIVYTFSLLSSLHLYRVIAKKVMFHAYRSIFVLDAFSAVAVVGMAVASAGIDVDQDLVAARTLLIINILSLSMFHLLVNIAFLVKVYSLTRSFNIRDRNRTLLIIGYCEIYLLSVIMTVFLLILVSLFGVSKENRRGSDVAIWDVPRYMIGVIFALSAVLHLGTSGSIISLLIKPFCYSDNDLSMQNKSKLSSHLFYTIIAFLSTFAYICLLPFMFLNGLQISLLIVIGNLNALVNLLAVNLTMPIKSHIEVVKWAFGYTSVQISKKEEDHPKDRRRLIVGVSREGIENMTR